VSKPVSHRFALLIPRLTGFAFDHQVFVAFDPGFAHLKTGGTNIELLFVVHHLTSAIIARYSSGYLSPIIQIISE